MEVNFVLKMLGAKTRDEIRRGKLWEITRLWGMDVWRRHKEVAKPLPRVQRHEECVIEKLQVHSFKDEDNKTDMTKKPDLM